MSQPTQFHRAPHPRVIVVEDDPVSRTYLTRLAERTGCAVDAYPDAEQFLAAFDPAKPALVLLDLSLPGIGGTECLERLAALRPMPAVVVVTGTAEVADAVKSLRLGALHLLEKPADERQVAAALALGLEAARTRHDEDRRCRDVQAKVASLSPREREVFDLVVRGAMNKEVAQQLGIAAKTVEVHRANVMRKLEVDSLAQLVRLAVDAVACPADPLRADLLDSALPRDPAPGRRPGTQAEVPPGMPLP
ncbi:MAG: response regulator [Planctomycetaceae bacterium]|nr:response regulator [Planctomycetaceae bacterium]